MSDRNEVHSLWLGFERLDLWKLYQQRALAALVFTIYITFAVKRMQAMFQPSLGEAAWSILSKRYRQSPATPGSKVCHPHAHTAESSQCSTCTLHAIQHAGSLAKCILGLTTKNMQPKDKTSSP